MRIDFVITELFVGGAERCLTELAIGCAKQGDRVRVASIGTLPPEGQDRLVTRLRKHDIEVFSAKCDRPWQFFAARAKLRRWMLQDPPDIVQTMLFHANLVGILAAHTAGVPVRVGGIRVAERSRFRSWLEARAMKQMSAVVCVSDSVQRFVRHSRKTSTPLHVIGNSIDPVRVETIATIDWPTVLGPSAGNVPEVLLFVGRLHPQKGLDVLFEALPSLFARFPEMHVCICGDGPLRQWAQDMITSLDTDRVKLVGWRSDAMSLIKGCRLLVLPSRYEGMPNVVMEAMAAAKPVAATRVEGVGELLREGANDQSCESENSVALRQLIERLWGDPQRAMLIGQRNREIIAAHHSTLVMVQSYRDLYLDLHGNASSVSSSSVG